MSSESVAIIGMGKMGTILADLAHDVSLPCATFDQQREGSLADTCANATLIVLAVPLEALRQALLSVKPLLKPGQVVLDVCSVKLRSEAVLQAVLGADGPWVGTHPLFGPSSLYEPKRVVVCQRPGYEALTDRARCYFQQLGCQVLLMSSDEHDRVMAKSQALATVLGAAMREMGLASHNDAYPPSTAPLHALALAQNAQPSHLRDTMLYANQHASTVRAQLFTTLAMLDSPSSMLQMRVPATESLASLRDSIDAIDRGIIDLLSRRADVARAISTAKSTLGRPVKDEARETQAFEDRVAWAGKRHIDRTFATKLFEMILSWSRSLQTQERDEADG